MQPSGSRAAPPRGTTASDHAASARTSAPGALWPLLPLLLLAALFASETAHAQPGEARVVPADATGTPVADRASGAAQGNGAPAAALSRRAGTELGGIDAADATLVERALVDLSAHEGKPVRAISVETTGTRWQDRPALKSVPLGTPLSAPVARRALDELLETGRFAQAYADARAYQDGVILRLVAVPRRIVASVQIESGPLPEARVRAALGLEPGAEITEPMLRDLGRRVRQHYRRYGYDGARVTLELTDTDDPMRVLVRLAVDAGQARTISRRVFVIEPRYDRVVGDRKRSYSVESGDRIDEDLLLDADGELGELLRKERFLAATVKHRVLRRGRHAFLYVYLDTGPQTRFRFEGRRAFDERDLVEALALGSTQDTDPQSLADRLRSYYVQRGFFDARVRAAEAQLEDGAVREISFSLVEGEPVRVARRLFPCLPLDAGPGLGAADLGAEIDAFLDGDLPKTSLLASVDETVVDGLLGGGGGRRAAPHRLVPALTYHPDSYERALKHLEEVLASKGYLNSRVGPVSVIRAECDPTARAGRCAPLGLPPYPEPACRVDALDLPLAEPPLDERLECVPEPGRGISCAPELTVSIPVLLGPATVRYDLSFEGNKTLSAHELAEIAEFPLGEPFSILELDAARSRIQNAYADRGYTYAEVRADVDYSPDRTRARARFTVNERQPVVITGYEVRGAVRTDPARIIGRLALCRELERCSDEERVFKRNLARASEEQIATLGTFASVSLGLEDPDIPQARKRVIITVVEQRSQYLEPRAGFSTGEGLRLAFEYGHRNVGGQAIALTVRLEFAFLPDALILDRDVRENYARFVNDVAERLERRNSVSLRFPEIGLGPKVELAVDGIDVRDNQRDFGLGREAVVPTLSYRPARSVTLQGATSVEVNDVTLFDEGGVAAAIKRNPALANLLRVPDGRTLALAQRASVSWDRRDNALSATRGTFVTTGVEHVSALPLDPQTVLKSEFLRLTTRGAGYVPLTEGGMALAISMAVGYNLQLTSDSVTYPDRLFFLGGVSTVRGFQLDSVVPEDVARQLLDGHIGIDDVGVRGGNLYVNPRVELRLPLNDTFSVGLFLDTGNVWSEPESIESVSDLLALRYAAGTGLRASTPIGPVALDGGINLVRREWEDVGAIHFSIGLF